jgi:hypothetical protein
MRRDDVCTLARRPLGLAMPFGAGMRPGAWVGYFVLQLRDVSRREQRSAAGVLRDYETGARLDLFDVGGDRFAVASHEFGGYRGLWLVDELGPRPVARESEQ